MSANGPDRFNEEYAAIQVRRSRNPLRRLVRYWYLSDILKHLNGPGIDFGCGAGDLLARMPVGSIGLEINPVAVDYCRGRGLDAHLYDPEKDAYQLGEIRSGTYKCVVFTHVLEHLESPDDVLRCVMRSCKRIGVSRVVITQPCEKGFKFDKTHRTFVDPAYFSEKGLYEAEGFRVSSEYRFPLNVKWLGSYYTFHEWRVVFDRID